MNNGKSGIAAQQLSSRRNFNKLVSLAMASTGLGAGVVLVSTLRMATACFQSLIDRAVDRLYAIGQPGSNDNCSVGTTALVTLAILRNRQTSSDAAVEKSFAKLQDAAQSDGGIYTLGKSFEAQETCRAVLCLAAANAEGRFAKLLENAHAFLRRLQWSEERGKTQGDGFYGGVGAGRQNPPDLTNTALFVDAMRAVGVSGDDPAIQKAVVFVSRCQRFSDFNAKGSMERHCDVVGAFCSTASGETQSDGLLTHIGLNCLLSAGVRPNDARTKAALSWIQKHYNSQENPGMGMAGLFHYYHACARTFCSLHLTDFEDAAGAKHHWREEIASAIVSRQRQNGSWMNDNAYWSENNPAVATANAIMALSYC